MPQITVEQALQIAVRHHQAGEFAKAEKLYRQIIEFRPNQPDAIHFLGVIALQSGNNELAVELIRQAISLRPNYTDAHSNLGNALKDLGRLDEAIAAYQQAVMLDPLLPEAHNNLGIALREKGLFEQAVASFNQAIALKVDYVKAYSNLGAALQDQGRLDDAIAAFHRAIACKADYAEAFTNLGNVLKEQGLLDQAIVACRRAIELKPDYAEAWNNLAIALSDAGQLDEAIAAYRRAIACRPGFVQAHSNLIFAMNYQPSCTAPEIAAEAANWNHQHAEPLCKFILGHSNDRDPARRLRIGYVSADLNGHPVGRFLLPLLREHHTQQFEIFTYAQVRAPDSTTEQLRSHTDHWRDILGLSDQQAAELIREDKIDILVDLALHTARHRLLVFAQKPAPVQVSWLGYPGTTGLTTIDYRLSDPHLDPPGWDDTVYSEKTIRLPDTYWCYEPVEVDAAPGEPPARSAGHITFGCLNNFRKISPQTLATWAEVLRAVPGSQLLLHADAGGHRQKLQIKLEQAGVDSHRIRFAGKTNIADYFRLYHQIDIALDTFPYGGGTTTCDALWMGVPVVSLAGKTAVGRGGLSILSNIGLPELVADAESGYIRIAVDLANDLTRLTHLRSSLRQRMQQSPLMDASRFARSIEAAYRRMWLAWCNMAPTRAPE